MKAYRGYTRWEAFTDWLREWWILLLVGSAVLTLIVYCIVTAEPTKYIQAPIESCSQVRTGNTRTYDMPSTVCASNDNNGVCTNQITTYYSQTDVEVRVTCDFTEWRTE